MKWTEADVAAAYTKGSPPSRGAWIEISRTEENAPVSPESPPSRGAWIEIFVTNMGDFAVESPPSRGAWIEIPAV